LFIPAAWRSIWRAAGHTVQGFRPVARRGLGAPTLVNAFFLPIFSSSQTPPKTRPAVTPTAALTIVTNPGSTGNLRAPDWIAPIIAGETGVNEVRGGTPEAIMTAVKCAVADGCEILVVNGGDGTANLAFSALFAMENSRPPAVMILPSGKTNMTSASWNRSGEKAEALRRLLSLRRAGNIAAHLQPQTVLAVRQSPDKAPVHGAFLGAADVVDGILMCRRTIYPLGLPNAVSHSAAVSLMFWRAMLGGADKDVAVSWPDGGESGRFFFAGVTALDQLILGLRPEPAEGSGPLTYLSLGGGPRALGAALPALLAGRIDQGFRRTVRRAERITLRFTGAYTLDGELYESDAATPIEITAAGPLPFVRLP